jgi:hypothetical protein
MGRPRRKYLPFHSQSISHTSRPHRVHPRCRRQLRRRMATLALRRTTLRRSSSSCGRGYGAGTPLARALGEVARGAAHVISPSVEFLRFELPSFVCDLRDSLFEETETTNQRVTSKRSANRVMHYLLSCRLLARRSVATWLRLASSSSFFDLERCVPPPTTHCSPPTMMLSPLGCIAPTLGRLTTANRAT